MFELEMTARSKTFAPLFVTFTTPKVDNKQGSEKASRFSEHWTRLPCFSSTRSFDGCVLLDQGSKKKVHRPQRHRGTSML